VSEEEKGQREKKRKRGREKEHTAIKRVIKLPLLPPSRTNLRAALMKGHEKKTQGREARKRYYGHMNNKFMQFLGQ
jgi:hypothetical protein